MKKLLSASLMMLLLLAFMLGTIRPVDATDFLTATVNVNALRVRSGPGLTNAHIATVNRGSVLPVLSQQQSWTQISLRNGQAGWVATEFITLRNEQPSRWARVTVASLNVRSGPSITFSRITGVTMGTVLPILHSQDSWHQIRLSSGQIGWVSSTHVTVSATSPLPVVAPVPTPTLNQQSGTVTHFSLPVRSGPDPTSPAITTLPQQTHVTILQTQGRWHQIRLATDQVGWVFAQYITTNSIAPVPISNPSPIVLSPVVPPAPVANPRPGTVTMSDLPLRSEPDSSSFAITGLGINSQLTILQTRGNWHEVRLPTGETGWVFAQHISINPPELRRLARVAVPALNMRSSPSMEAERIALLPLGTMVEVIAENGAWFQILLSSGETGWVFAEFVAISNPRAVSLAGQVILIDPGHGGRDPGAVGPTGLLEKEVVLDVSLRVADRLRQAGATVILTRENDSTVSLTERVNLATAANAGIFVSIHTNAHTNTAIGGTETFFFQHNTFAPASRLLAEYIQRELVRGLGLLDRRVKHGNFHVIREATMPSVLVELAFTSNPQEEALMRTNDFRQNSADAIFRGIDAYFRL